MGDRPSSRFPECSLRNERETTWERLSLANFYLYFFFRLQIIGKILFTLLKNKYKRDNIARFLEVILYSTSTFSAHISSRENIPRDTFRRKERSIKPRVLYAKIPLLLFSRADFPFNSPFNALYMIMIKSHISCVIRRKRARDELYSSFFLFFRLIYILMPYIYRKNNFLLT